MLRIIVWVVFLGVCAAEYGWVTWGDGPQPQVVTAARDDAAPAVHVARATYSNQVNETGWAYLELHTEPDSSDEQQAYAAGYLEGFLTRDLIWLHWYNTLKGYCYNKQEECALIDDFIDKNERFVAGMVKDHPDDPYWYQVKLFYIQLEGVAAGYNQATTDPSQQLSIRDITWLNIAEEIPDISMSVAPSPQVPDRLYYGARCSGLVKLLQGELFTAHVTWSEYQTMLRVQKKYVLSYRLAPRSAERLPGRAVAMSSYPGLLHSLDDFYMTSSGLVIAETTLSNSNKTLFTLITPAAVATAARAAVAARVARRGRGWVEVFRKFNSGTYNNEWYVVDYKKFKASRDSTAAPLLGAGLLWVLEQLPGAVRAKDLTEHLKRATYFSSYNIPMFPEMFALSGGEQRVREHGDWFGYHTNPRAKIFREEQASVRSVAGMLALMRYNDYRRDPRARCACRPPYSAENAISARNDLNPANGSYPFSALGHRAHGGTDAKVASAALQSQLRFLSVSGPTYDEDKGIPPFEWSKFDLGAAVPHAGQPDRWVFPPRVHPWEWE